MYSRAIAGDCFDGGAIDADVALPGVKEQVRPADSVEVILLETDLCVPVRDVMTIPPPMYLACGTAMN